MPAPQLLVSKRNWSSSIDYLPQHPASLLSAWASHCRLHIACSALGRLLGLALTVRNPAGWGQREGVGAMMTTYRYQRVDLDDCILLERDVSRKTTWVYHFSTQTQAVEGFTFERQQHWIWLNWLSKIIQWENTQQYDNHWSVNGTRADGLVECPLNRSCLALTRYSVPQMHVVTSETSTY